jgi:hypothetical protein
MNQKILKEEILVKEIYGLTLMKEGIPYNQN